MPTCKHWPLEGAIDLEASTMTNANSRVIPLLRVYAQAEGQCQQHTDQ